MTRATDGGGSRLLGWLTAALSPFIVLGWVLASIAAWTLLPALGGSSAAPLDDIVPAGASALAAQERAFERFGSTLGTDTVVVQRNPRGLSLDETEATLRGSVDAIRKRLPPELDGVVGAAPVVNVPLPGIEWGETGTTALTYLFLAPDLNLVERERLAQRYVDRMLTSEPGTVTGVTGAGPARLQQFEEIDAALPWVEAATVAVILVIVALYFRSIAAPLVTLLTAAIAYVVATRSLGWAGERAGVTVPSEIEPVLVVLLLGLVTDYTIFFMSEARRRLRRGEPRLLAARRTTARIAPIVFAAGILVAGGTIALMAGRMEFFRVFGPGLAASALAVTLVCVTFVPAVLVLLGPWLFGRAVREGQPPAAPPPESRPPAPASPNGARERWRLRASGMLGALRASRTQARHEGGRVSSLFGTRLLSTRPAALLIGGIAVAVLVIAATQARTLDLGVSHTTSLPRDTQARLAADDAARGLTPGALAPTELVVIADGITGRREELARLQDALGERPGVGAVLGPAHAVVDEVEPVVLARDGGAARYALFLDFEPSSADAVNAVGALREAMPRLLRASGLPPDTRVEYAGESALAEETVDSIVADLGRIAIAVAIVTFVLLALFLRSLVAPLLLLGGSVLAFAASLGLMALLLPELLGGTDVVYYVPLVGAVLLVGLGSDYNVFIAARIREEAGRRRLGEAIAVAAPSASRAITVAGITLASTFALLALVPLRPFRELALLMSVGVLVDALLVRPLLIPALIALVGRVSWWPGSPQKPGLTREFEEEVAHRSGQTPQDARRATAATLATLAERIPEREARALADLLPEGLRGPLAGADGGTEAFSADEFVARVAERTGESRTSARADVEAVVATLAARLAPTELDYVRAALSEDYRPLFGDATGPAGDGRAEPLPTG